jgi:hypothetical protein
MSKIPFDPAQPDIEKVRQIVMERLRHEPHWQQLDNSGAGFDPYVKYTGQPHPAVLAFRAQEVFWQLVIELILAPGMNPSNMSLPWFHRTAYGIQVIEEQAANPYDQTDYLQRLTANIHDVDATVITYLQESLATFRHGNLVASTVMLGIAAERVFLLLCDSMAQALANTTERQRFERLLKKFPMKPKLDWVHQKVQNIQLSQPQGLPENAPIMITAIYELMRGQRNELGHPREQPPNLSQPDVYTNLQIFPRYYETAEAFRDFLAVNTI